MERNRVIAKLKDYKDLKAEIKRLEYEIELSKINETYGLKAMGYDGIKTSPTNKVSQPTCEIALDILDNIEKLELKKRLKELELQQINNAISCLTEAERFVIINRYIEEKQFKEIWGKDFRERKCFNLHNSAIEKLCKWIDG